MDNALYGAQNDAQGPELSQQAVMAGMLIGPIIADQGMRDGIRDAAAAALGDAGIAAVTLHLEDRRRVTLTPTEVIEVFFSRLGAEFGFSIPDYLTLSDATEGITSNSAK